MNLLVTLNQKSNQLDVDKVVAAVFGTIKALNPNGFRYPVVDKRKEPTQITFGGVDADHLEVLHVVAIEAGACEVQSTC